MQCSRHKAGVVGEFASGAVELANIDNVRPYRAFVDWEINGWRAIGKRQRCFGVRLGHGSTFDSKNNKIHSPLLCSSNCKTALIYLRRS